MKHALAFLGLCVASAIASLVILYPVDWFGGCVKGVVYFTLWVILSLISGIIYLVQSND